MLPPHTTPSTIIPPCLLSKHCLSSTAFLNGLAMIVFADIVILLCFLYLHWLIKRGDIDLTIPSLFRTFAYPFLIFPETKTRTRTEIKITTTTNANAKNTNNANAKNTNNTTTKSETSKTKKNEKKITTCTDTTTKKKHPNKSPSNPHLDFPSSHQVIVIRCSPFSSLSPSSLPLSTSSWQRNEQYMQNIVKQWEARHSVPLRALSPREMLHVALQDLSTIAKSNAIYPFLLFPSFSLPVCLFFF